MFSADQYILIVDDDAELRGALAQWCEAQGRPLRTAASAEEALAVAAELEDALGLVITDLELPGMDGVRLILELRRQPGREHLAAVLMTGARNVLLPDRVAFVQKPFLLSGLVSAAHAAHSSAVQHRGTPSGAET